MDEVEVRDPLAFLQEQIAALELTVRAIIGDDPERRAQLARAAGLLVAGATQGAPPEFVAGWHRTLRSVNGGSLPALGAVPAPPAG